MASGRGHYLVRPNVDHVSLVCGEMRRNQVMVIRINREVVEALSTRSVNVELRNLLQGLSECSLRTHT